MPDTCSNIFRIFDKSQHLNKCKNVFIVLCESQNFHCLEHHCQHNIFLCANRMLQSARRRYLQRVNGNLKAKGLLHQCMELFAWSVTIDEMDSIWKNIWLLQMKQFFSQALLKQSVLIGCTFAKMGSKFANEAMLPFHCETSRQFLKPLQCWRQMQCPVNFFDHIFFQIGVNPSRQTIFSCFLQCQRRANIPELTVMY